VNDACSRLKNYRLQNRSSYHYRYREIENFATTTTNSFDSTKDINVGLKTLSCSVAAALFRIVSMPIDTVKTIMQLTGKFSADTDKVKRVGSLVLYNSSIGAAAATFVGHYP
jgi:hypothetical protein